LAQRLLSLLMTVEGLAVILVTKKIDDFDDYGLSK
jgi:hypothetical protein